MYTVKYKNNHAKYKTWGSRFVILKHLHMGTRGWQGDSEYYVCDTFQASGKDDEFCKMVGFENLRDVKNWLSQTALGELRPDLVKLEKHPEWEDYK